MDNYKKTISDFKVNHSCRRLLLIVVKNTSILDTAFPLLWHIAKHHPETEISILYCKISKAQILRNYVFYSRTAVKYKIQEYDFSSFLPFPFGFLGSIISFCLGRSDRDIGVETKGVKKWWRGVIRKASGRFEKYLISKTNFTKILQSINPDTVLLDHRTNGLRLLYKQGFEFVEYFMKHNTKVVLLPHGAHHGDIDDFTPFDSNDPLPDFCDYWIPFRFDRNWGNIPEKRNQFFHSGYPGLDSAWLNFLRSNRNSCNSKSKPLRCLYITRKFLREGANKPPLQEFTLTYEEFVSDLKLINRSIEELNQDIELVIKPHPNNDYRYLEHILKQAGVRNYSIMYDSVYARLFDFDFIVGIYSTTLIPPLLAGIPVILIHSPWQELVHSWEKKKELYTNLQHYLVQRDMLPVKMAEVIQSITEDNRSNADVRHLRYFWPDNCMDECTKRLGLVRGEKL